MSTRCTNCWKPTLLPNGGASDGSMLICSNYVRPWTVRRINSGVIGFEEAPRPFFFMYICIQACCVYIHIYIYTTSSVDPDGILMGKRTNEPGGRDVQERSSLTIFNKLRRAIVDRKQDASRTVFCPSPSKHPFKDSRTLVSIRDRIFVIFAARKQPACK